MKARRGGQAAAGSQKGRGCRRCERTRSLGQDEQLAEARANATHQVEHGRGGAGAHQVGRSASAARRPRAGPFEGPQRSAVGGLSSAGIWIESSSAWRPRLLNRAGGPRDRLRRGRVRSRDAGDWPAGSDEGATAMAVAPHDRRGDASEDRKGWGDRLRRHAIVHPTLYEPGATCTRSRGAVLRHSGRIAIE